MYNLIIAGGLCSINLIKLDEVSVNNWQADDYKEHPDKYDHLSIWHTLDGV